MKLLVTGSSGMIGTSLCLHLLKKNVDFVGLDVVPNPWSLAISKRTILADLKTVKWYSEIPKDVDAVIHLAANARVETSVSNPNEAIENIITTKNVLDFIRTRSIPTFLFTSSKEVYGTVNDHPISEEETDLRNCENPYAASKIAGEALIQAYCKCYGLDSLIVRFSNVYGPYDMYDRAIPIFIRKSLKGEQLVVYDRDKSLDFVYVEDVVDGLMDALKNFDKVKNSVFNLAAGTSYSLETVAQLVQKIVGKSNEIEIKPRKPGEILKFTANISNARAKLNYAPLTSLEEGITKTVEWFKELQKENEKNS